MQIDFNIINTTLSLIISNDVSLYDMICDYFTFIELLFDNSIDNSTYNEYVKTNKKFDNISFVEYINIKHLYQTNNESIVNILDKLIYYIKNNKLLKKKLTYSPLIQTNESIIKLLINNLSMYDINYQTDKIINLYSGLGSIMEYTISNNLSTNNIIGYDPNEKFNYINKKNLQIITKTNYDNQIHTNDILTDNLNINNANLILCDIPENIKNIIHAKCSNNIKQLKIRGTKSEPLIIQLITTLLAKNGIAGVIIADSFLYNDSVQHIETRKFLIAKFTISKIINLIDVKKSILIFKNSGPTENITMCNLSNDQIINLNTNQINNNSSLYYYHYDLYNTNIINKSNILSSYITINTNTNTDTDTLFILKYNQLQITKPTNIETYDYVFITKNEEILRQNFLNNYIKQLLEKHIDNLVKGKIRQYDIQLINNLLIDIPSIQIQDQIITHLNLSRQQLLNYQSLIDNLLLLKKRYIESVITNKPLTQLKNIIRIEYKSNNINTIRINRNSNLVGKVSLTTTIDEESTNYYYLHLINTTTNNTVLYHILKYYEDELFRLANLNSINQLARQNLEKLEIPIFTEELINKILHCNKFDMEISNLYKKISLTNLTILDIL